MPDRTVGLLHPGEMGSVVGACARRGGARALWASAGRSSATRKRAAAAGLEDVGAPSELAGRCDVIVSVVPPHAALEVARALAKERFGGVYVDANAVAPATSREIGTVVEREGARFVDGGIVGPPPTTAGSTRLYLCGDSAPSVAELFAEGPLEAIVLEAAVGAASALKASYAAWTKGSAALLVAVRELAQAYGVEPALLAEWARSQPGLGERSERAGRDEQRKAWRFVGEMEEIAAAFEAAGLPAGFHRAAAEVFQRLARAASRN